MINGMYQMCGVLVMYPPANPSGLQSDKFVLVRVFNSYQYRNPELS